MVVRSARLADAADRLVDLYTALGRSDEVRKWRAERAKYPFVAPPPRPRVTPKSLSLPINTA